jgi:hypothetical protein
MSTSVAPTTPLPLAGPRQAELALRGRWGSAGTDALPGVTQRASFARLDLPNPPPQGGRERALPRRSVVQKLCDGFRQ